MNHYSKSDLQNSITALLNDFSEGASPFLLTFDDHQTFISYSPEEISVSANITHILLIDNWGLSPIEEALRRGSSLFVSDNTRLLFIYTDGLNTYPDLYIDYNILKELQQNGIHLCFLFPEWDENEKFYKAIQEYLDNNRIHWFYQNQLAMISGFISDMHKTLPEPENLSSENDVNITHAAESQENPVEQTSIRYITKTRFRVETGPWKITFHPFYVFLALFLWYLCGLVYRDVFPRIRKLLVKEPPQHVEYIRLSVRHGNDPVIMLSSEKELVSMAVKGEADLPLERPPKSPLSLYPQIMLERMGEVLLFSSRKPLLFNGVGARSRIMKAGDSFVYGAFRVTFDGVFTRNIIKSGNIGRFNWQTHIPAILFFIILVFINQNALTISPPAVRHYTVSVAVEPKENPSAQETARDVITDEADESVLVVEHDHVSNDLGDFYSYLGYDPTAGYRTFKAVNDPPVIIRDNDFPAGADVDMLFIHVHPDDESLDFGVLMRTAVSAGKKIMNLILTDGEAGLDQFPHRTSGGAYPERDLEGSELAAVRTNEAAAALTILGSSYYIAPGLRNLPYGGYLDIRDHAYITEGWGGYSALSAYLEKLIYHFKPEVIVAPDGPTDALEHFEHETCGLLVEKILNDLRSDPDLPVKGLICSIDPFQKEKYSGFERLTVDGMAIDPVYGINFRNVQYHALKMHRTQRDSTVIGVERLPLYQFEYYFTKFWNLDVSPEQYLRFSNY